MSTQQPPKPKKVIASVRLDPAVYQRLKDYAAQKERTFHWVTAKILTQASEKLS